MDVTSLLNLAAARHPITRTLSLESTSTISTTDGSSAAPTTVQTPSPGKTTSSRRTSDNHLSRLRTPWDAGGYSLPLTLDTKKLSVLSRKPSIYSVSPTDQSAPQNLYDTASVNHHSRASSLSSLGFDMAHSVNVTPMTSTHPGRQPSVSEADSQLTARPRFSRDDSMQGGMGLPNSPRHKFSDSHSSLSSYTSSTMHSGSHSRISSMSTVSGGVQPFNSLLNDMPSFETKLGETQQMDSAPPSLELRSQSPRTATSPSALEEGDKDPRRPSSPSDAILITRGTGSSRSSPTEDFSPQHITKQDTTGFLNPPQDQLHTRSHKRTVSAPDFAALSAPSGFQPFPPVSEAPAFVQQQQVYTMPSQTQPAAGNPAVIPEIKCMYIENCDTYRNGHEYAKLQIDLVEQQIERVQEWSDANKRAGTSGVVTSWSLAIRKREQKRLDDKQESRKRSYQDESEDEAADGAVMNGTAVPQWLLDRCGNNYSTETIMSVVQQLKSEIHGNHLSQIPDIEILPAISSDGNEDKPKAQLKRKTSGGNGHKRSQSMGVALRHDIHPPPAMTRRISQPLGHWEADMFENPVEKRQRLAQMDVGYFAERHNMVGVPRAAERTVPNVRRMQVAHRPAFGNIRENYPEEEYYPAGQQAFGSPYMYGAGGQVVTTSGGPAGGPLPAPTPQRRPSQSMASHLEANSSMAGYQDPRRPIHQRSHSEVGAFYTGSSNAYRPASSSEYPAPGYGYGPGPDYDASYNQGFSRREEDDMFIAGQPVNQGAPMGQQPPASNYYQDATVHRQYGYDTSPYQSGMNATARMAAPPATKHGRHQSSPNVVRGMQQHRGAPSHGYAPLPNMPARFEQPYEQQHMDQSRVSYGAPAVHRRPTMEDESTRDAYGVHQ
ncbi:hypothetical protein BN1723_014868 [Verticillium longisporum]|uniref:Uncharacterized protein n=1 Tax=Verticillium longisporum TaxID=100787 RepID=A0A0G4MK58_VERLO|nr:hypothetical protein BN1723_014868 [Verticillium longisporum]